MKRNPSVELLRCLAMGLIVAYHCFIYGEFNDSHAVWTLLFTSLVCWHVDAFLAISGWFGIRFSWKKVAKFVGLILFYNVLSWLWGGRSLGGGWFGNNYLLLMILAPGINRLVEYLMQNERPVAARWCVWGVLAAGMIVYWLPWHKKELMAWWMGGYSIANFVFVYLTVRMVRLRHAARTESAPYPKRWLLVGPVCFFGMFALFAGIDFVSRLTGRGHLSGIGSVFSSYDAPHVWIMAIAILLFFVWHVKIPVWLGKVATFCAPSMFGIYLLHDTTSFGHEIFRRPEAWLASHMGLHPTVIIVLSALFTFGVCLTVDLCRRGALAACVALGKRLK